MRRRPWFQFALLLGLAQMNAQAQAPIAPHFDARDLDAKTPACRDFDQYANGGWLKANPVPAGLGSWGTLDQMAQRNLEQQRALLEAASSAPDGELDALLGNLYASGMDEAGIEAAGATPLAPLFQRIDQLQKPRQLAPLLAELHARGLPVLFDFGSAVDLRDPSRRVASFGQGGFALPDREYYLRADPQTATLKAAYRAYVERLLSLTGSTTAASDAEWVVAIEARLAQAALGLVPMRDPNNVQKVAKVKALDKLYPALQVKKFLKAQGLAKIDAVSLAPEAFFAEVQSLATTLSPAQWRAYLRFQVAHALAPFLSRPFQDAHEALFVRTLRGSQEALPRWRRVLGTVETLVGPALGQRFVELHFPAARRDAAGTLVADIRAALRQQIEGASWIGTAARAPALAKLDALQAWVGHGDRWPSFDGLEFARSGYAANVLAAVQWKHRRQLALIANPEADLRWPQPAHAVNAYYDPARNQLVLPAGFLQPPLFDPQADAALNYGALGALIGHELMHGFDAIGSTFSADGRIAPWLDAADANGYAQRVKPLEAQYDAYAALGPIKVSGRLTLPENVADLAGLQTAWRAFQARNPGNAKIEGHTPAQRFFLAWARVWRRNYRDEALTLLLQTDVHAPAKFRVNGPLANLEPFAQAFACKPGKASFVRKPAERVSVW